jgi:hypothetical protein
MCIGLSGDDRESLDNGLLLLVSVLSQTLFTLVRSHFVLLSFLSAWHNTFCFSLRPVADPQEWFNNYFKSFRYESTVA